MSDTIYIPTPPHEYTRYISLTGMFHNTVDHDDRKMVAIAEEMEKALNALGVPLKVNWINIADMENNPNGDLGRFRISVA